MSMRARLLILTGISLLVAVADASAAQATAASCSSTSVASAVSNAADGDVVAIPAGICTWTSHLTIAKGISVIGAGEGVTIISGGGFNFTTPSGKSFRVSGMTIRGVAGIGVYANSKSWRIDHITFENVTGRPDGRIIWIQPSNGDHTAGVIDHVTFINPRSIQVHYRGSTRDGGNNEWIRPLGLGSSDAVYIEDSVFSHSSLEVSAPVTDCDGGGRFVFRFNTVSNAYIEMHDAIVDGLRGCRKWEIYNNTFTRTYNSGQCTFVSIRGGTGVAFNNKFVNRPDCDDGIHISLYRTYQTSGSPWSSLCRNTSGKACLGTTSVNPKSCTSDAGCGGAVGSCIAIDGASASPSGYLCRDQMGTDGNSPQVSRPALFWNNTVDGKQVVVNIESGGSYYAVNRDYCVGSSKPTSCNGQTTTYASFAYPHPLTHGDDIPSAPANVRIIR
jgi:hypothetical protein